MSIKHLQLTEGLYNYLLKHSLRENPQLIALREYTETLPMAIMQISPEQGQFMQFLLKLTQAKRVLEVGVFTGYSSLAMALALPADGEIIALDTSEEWTSVAKQYWNRAQVANKIQLHLAPALKTLEKLQAEQTQSFDAAFIDADKENYVAYYESCLMLVRSGGLIMIDNTLRGGSVIDPSDTSLGTKAIRELNNMLLKDQRVEISMLPISDGLTLLLKK